jgi:hypothetical protein
MSYSPIEFQFVKLDRQEKEHKQQKRRLVREALAGKQHVHFYNPLLARIGAGLVTFGTSLQERYGQHRLPTSPAFDGA